MATCNLQCLWGLCLSFSLSLCFVLSISTSNVYIVYLGQKQFGDPALTSKSHIQLLSDVFESEAEVSKSILYSYKHSFSGFSAKLNATQATALAKKKEVISVFKSKILELHTTRSWDFLGLPLDGTGTFHDDDQKVTPLQLSYGRDVIVGIFDTGIWPEAESFKEEACVGPIPAQWKGECVGGQEFDPKTACNRKLIGARYYVKGFEEEYGPLSSSGNPEYRSPRDFVGHGTHTASTAVGSVVTNASFFGFARGTARGGAPRARLAVYKVCWGKNYSGKCAEADVLAAFDDALCDGVNVISASFGAQPPLMLPFDESKTDIGAFHAMQLGVTVVFSAGNEGPAPSLVNNVSPWSICVAASSIDRTFPTKIILNNNFSITGQGLISKEINGKMAVCEKGSWLNNNATGRVILCFANIGPVADAEIAQKAVKLANGSGLIFVDSPTKQIPEVDIVPTILFDVDQGMKIINYLRPLAKIPVIQILPSTTVIGETPAPVVAAFSSRGPSSFSPDILKPDITAPGVNILAAWPSKTPPTPSASDCRRVNWNFQSGTSMSCPHVTGVVALLKSAHPDWSPAAIRSALITTASTRDNSQDSILAGGSVKVSDPFDMGAGQVDPTRAMDPGLIYDMQTSDYLIFLCNLGYTQDQIDSIILRKSSSSSFSSTSTCSFYRHYSNADINYPSITVSNLQSTTTIKRTVRRTTTAAASTTSKVSVYCISSVVEPDGVKVSIWPRVMIFSWFKEENSYFVTLKPLKKSISGGRFDFGEIVWSDGSHFVRSPLVVSVNTTTIPTTAATTITTTTTAATHAHLGID